MPLAPVLVKFGVTTTSKAWVVRVNGRDVPVRAGQSSVLVDVWDAEAARWRITVGLVRHEDVIWFQRQTGPLLAAAGAFTIPVLPLTIVYAPPVDALGASSARYVSAQTVGSTVDFSLVKDVNTTVPVQGSMFLTSLSLAKATFDGVAIALKKTGSKKQGKIFEAISDQIGQISSTQQTGVADGTDSSITLTQSVTDELRATIANGGPGVGDVLYFYQDVRMIWSYLDGQLRLCPIGYTRASLTAAGLRDHAETAGLSAADAAALLALDPFAGPTEPALPADRFTLYETWEYGFGAHFKHIASTARETTRRTTHRTYTTQSSGWDAGPILEGLGLGGTDTTTVTLTNAVGEATSSTATIEADLVSGPEDLFVVNVWYDKLFGTFAFEPLGPGPTVRFAGQGSGPAQVVVLRAGDMIFRTTTGLDGGFQFRAPSVPSGNATLELAGATRPVTI